MTATPFSLDDALRTLRQAEFAAGDTSDPLTHLATAGAADESIRAEFARLRARVEELTAPVACGVCGGGPLASGRKCVCGGVGTEQAEMHGLRVELFDCEAALATLRAAVRECADKLDNLSVGFQGEVDADAVVSVVSALRALLPEDGA